MGAMSILIVLVFFGILGGIIYIAMQKSDGINKKQAAKRNQKLRDKAAKKAERQANRIEKIRAETNQGILYETALNATDRKEATAAVETLTDEKLLYKLAMAVSREGRRGPQSYLAELAIEKIRDQDLLCEIARHASDSTVRIWAINKLENQEALVGIVFSEASPSLIGGDTGVKKAAIGQLEDQDALRKIAFSDDFSSDLRQAAMMRFSDAADIERFAREEMNHEARMAALDRVEDEALRNDIRASWSPEQRAFDKSYEDWQREKARLVQKHEMEREQSRKWAAEGRCPHCGMGLSAPAGGIPDGAIAICSNCGGRLN